MALKGQIWPILVNIGPKLTQNGQKRIKIPWKPNKTTFLHSFMYWVWILHKNTEYWLSRVKFGPFWPILDQNWPKMAKNISRDLENQTRPIFHTNLRDEYEFHIKILILAVKGQIWPQTGQKLTPSVQKLSYNSKHAHVLYKTPKCRF